MGLWIAVLVGPCSFLYLQDRPEQQVPPGHWSYKAFHTLATEGVILKYPAFDFLGGRVFTRGEMADLTADLLRALAEKPALATASRVEVAGRLVAEFEPEMKAAGLPTEVPKATQPVEPPKPAPKRIRAFGSDVHTATITEGNGNDTYTRTLDMNLEGDWFAAKLAGSMDTKSNDGVDRHTGDLFIGDRLSWQATERYFEAFGQAGLPWLQGRVRAGDMRNTTFASGLVLGASDIDGFRGSLRASGSYELLALTGHAGGGTDVAASRASVSLFGNALVAGLHGARIEAGSDAKSGDLVGLSLFYTDKFVDAWMEFADDLDHGSGLFLRGIFHYHHNLQFQADLRNYHHLLIDENSPPIYAGISGGQDEDDRGLVLRSVYAPIPWLTLTGKVEQAERHGGSDARRDLFGEGRCRPWKGGDGFLSYELESVDDTNATNSLFNLGFSQLIGEEGSTSLAYTRDDRDGEVIHTLRDSVRYTFFKGKLALELSHTFRKDTVGSEHILQPRALYTLSPNVFASVRATVSSDDDRTDPSVEFTVVVRW
jgi:hypothetical protein